MTTRIAGRPLSYYVNAFGFDERGVFFEPGRVAAAFAVLRDAGVPRAAIAGTNLLEPARCDVRDCVLRVRELAGESGYLGGITSVHLALPTWARLSEDQTPVVENLLANVDVFRPLEPAAFVIHAGTVHGGATNAAILEAYRDETARHGEDAVIAAVARNLRVMADAARPHGIRLALENLPSGTSPLGSPGTLPRLVAAVGRPNAGYCVDSGHAHLCGESPTAWLRTAGPLLFETHFHDNRGAGADEHLPVGFGTIDWREVVCVLDGIGFTGPVTFETGGWPLPDAAEGYRRAMEWWRICGEMAARTRT